MKLSRFTLSMTMVGLLASTGVAQQNQNDQQKNTDQRNKSHQSYQEQRQTPGQSRIVGKTTTSAVAISQPFLAMRASEVIGKEIQNAQGKEIGDVNDLLIDLPQGRIAGVVVGTGGVLGIGEQNRVVPPQAFTCQGKEHADATAKDRSKDSDDARASDRAQKDAKDAVLVLNMDEKLRASKTTEQDLKSYQHLDQVYRDYQQTPYWDKNAQNDRQAVREQDRAASGTKMTSFQLKKANELMGSEVKGQANKDVGELQDFIIDVQSGRILYATLSVGGTLGVGADLVAVPPRQFAMNSEGNLTLKTTEERLKNAPRLDEERLSELNDPTWVSKVYGYYGETDYWSTEPGNSQKYQDNDALKRDQERVREETDEKR